MDEIEKVKEAIEEEEITIEIDDSHGRVNVAIRTSEDSEFSVIGMGEEQNKTLSTFFRTYSQTICEIYKLHNTESLMEILPEEDTIEWCWQVGKELHDEPLGERTKKEKENFLSPLGEKYENISKWKVLRTEEVYELYPNKENLPDISVEEGSASVFAMTCRVCDNQEELEHIYEKLEPSDMKYMEYKMWRDLREKEDVEKEQIRELAEHHDNNGASEERKQKAVERVKKIV